MVSRTILLVDDDPNAVELFITALHGFDPDIKCYIADNGVDALKLLQSKSLTLPDLIFLDLKMPIMNGFECLEEMKEDDRLKDIPVIICTTSGDEHDKAKSVILGAHYFLHKDRIFQKFRDNLKSILQSTGTPGATRNPSQP